MGTYNGSRLCAPVHNLVPEKLHKWVWGMLHDCHLRIVLIKALVKGGLDCTVI